MRGRRKLLAGIASAGIATALSAFPQAASAQAAFSTRPIEPQNPLEEDFVAAFTNEAMRPAFRARLLESQVALALASSAPDAAPLMAPLRDQGRAGLIFTSAARLDSVLGADAPRVVLTGREALQRLRGGNVAINYRLIPMLTLEAGDVENFLRIPG